MVHSKFQRAAEEQKLNPLAQRLFAEETEEDEDDDDEEEESELEHDEADAGAQGDMSQGTEQHNAWQQQWQTPQH